MSISAEELETVLAVLHEELEKNFPDTEERRQRINGLITQVEQYINDYPKASLDGFSLEERIEEAQAAQQIEQPQIIEHPSEEITV